MAEIGKRASTRVDPGGLGERVDRLIDEWMNGFPLQLPIGLPWWLPLRMIRVDEHEDANGNLIVRAELPGIDPERDVNLSVSDGRLHIEAHYQEEETTDGRECVRHELRRGTVSRRLTLPAGAAVNEVTATYRDGILEIRVPVLHGGPPKKIPITKD